LIDLPNRDRDLHLPPKIAQVRIALRMAAAHLPLKPRISIAIVCGVLRPLVGITELVVVSAAIQIGMALPMAFWFHRVSWTGIAANLFVVPLIGLIVPLGFFTILTGWPLLARALATMIALMVRTVEWHARWTALEFRVPAPSVWLTLLLAFTLGALAWLLEKRRSSILNAPSRNVPSPPIAWPVRLGLVSVFLILAFALTALVRQPIAPRLEPGKLEVTALDVSQGEALFLGLPQGQTMLVDAGGLATFASTTAQMPDIGEEVVSPYLWSRAIRSIDVVVISHAHYDHIGGMQALLENFSVRELWVGKNPASPEYDRLLETAHSHGTRIVRLAAGDIRPLGGVSFQVLSPRSDYVPRSRPSNDDSVVLLANFGERSFLLTGDIERKSELRLAADRLLSHADLLKVPHHGSKTSSSELLLGQVRPWFALISAGADNPYGHPNADVLARLAESHATVFRTDRDGAITIQTDGHRLLVSTYEWGKAETKTEWNHR
jgi:competence protein ComEC